MKLKCTSCGRIFYTDQIHGECGICGEKLEDITSPAEEIPCQASSQVTRVINGIPGCDHYKLVNAMGHRCMRRKNPGKCTVASLPVYNPRVGVGR